MFYNISKKKIKEYIPKNIQDIEVTNIPQKKNRRLYIIPIFLLLVIVGTIITGLLPIQQLYSSDDEVDYNIKVSGLAWDLLDDRVLKVLIIPNPNLSGWKDSNVEDAKEGFDEWTICIKLFVQKYGFSYLENIKFEIDVSNENDLTKENYDIIINWTNQIDSKGAAGATVVLSDSEKRITKATITLPISVIKEGEKYVLSSTDIINIITDEIGHSFGLGHTNVKEDVLYGYYDFPQIEYCHSTLDVYGLAMVYQYMGNNSFEPLSKSTISLLETDIPFLYIREKN